MKTIRFHFFYLLILLLSVASVSAQWDARGGAVTAEDEGTELGFFTILDAVGAGVTAALSGNQLTLTIPGGGSATFTVQENDVNVSTVINILDFLGADFDVTESPSGEANIVIAAALARDSELHAAVTVSGTPDYITLSAQDIVRGLIDLTADVTGELPDANVSNTLQSSLFVGSGSTTNAIDLATAEVAGNLPDGNIPNNITIDLATTVTTNANLTGPITSVGNVTSIAAQTGTGTTFAMNTSPTLITPVLGVASATSLATSAATPFIITNGQVVNIAVTSQTVGATTLTIPDFANVVDSFSFITLAQTLLNKTLVTPTISGTGFTNAQHAHLGATSGGQVTEASISDLVHTTARTDEEITDLSGGMFTGNTETRVTVTFQDGDNTIDVIVDDMNDDIPESGDFGNANDLDAAGDVVDDSHNHVITNIDAFTKAQLETQTSDVADYAEADGDVYTNAHDFGGAALEITNADDPTSSATVPLVYDNNNDAVEVFDAGRSASYLIGHVRTFQKTIVFPDTLENNLPILSIWRIEALEFPFGVFIHQVAIQLEADAAYSMVFEEWSGDPLAAQADIETVTTGATDTYAEDSTITNNVVDADDTIVLDIPDTNVDKVHIIITYSAISGN